MAEIADLFTCARCGFCCRGETTVSLDEADQERISRMEDVRRRMEAAVAEENFEEAARLRDELRAMAPAREAKA